MILAVLERASDAGRMTVGFVDLLMRWLDRGGGDRG